MKRILVIEDDKLVRVSMLNLLEAENFQVYSAENGFYGLELAQNQKPDLIICDIMMPEMNGYEVLGKLRQDISTATIPFIFLSAKAEKGDLRRGMQLGADDYLTKPFTRKELLDAISTRLDKQALFVNHYSTEVRQTREKLNFLTNFDSLTNLLNRHSFQLAFNQIIESSPPCNQFLPLLFLDLDRFNRINDILGPSFSEKLVKAIARRIPAELTEKDIVARIQGDQFVILLTSTGDMQDTGAIARRILESLAQPYFIDDQEIFTTASIGISFYPVDGTNLDSLIRNASAALSYPKKQGGNDYQFYVSEMNTVSRYKLRLESDLRHSLERNEMVVHYQPQVSLQTGRIEGAEALLRWNHPQKGLIPPGEFIPIAEESGFILQLGEWILRTACQQLMEWKKDHLFPLRMAVNLSARQLNQVGLVEKVAAILNETGVEPYQVEMELTEGAILDSGPETNRTLNELKNLGLGLAIDDFGTGFSSLSYLKQFPFDSLKIDRSFIRNITTDPGNTAITMSTIQMAHRLNLRVIAEGVELDGELAFLRENNCDGIQGYLFSKPLAPPEFQKLLEANKGLQLN